MPRGVCAPVVCRQNGQRASGGLVTGPLSHGHPRAAAGIRQELPPGGSIRVSSGPSTIRTKQRT